MSVCVYVFMGSVSLQNPNCSSLRVRGGAFMGREQRISAAVTEWKHGNMKPKEGDGKNAKGGRTRCCYAKTCGGETAAVAYARYI